MEDLGGIIVVILLIVLGSLSKRKKPNTTGAKGTAQRRPAPQPAPRASASFQKAFQAAKVGAPPIAAAKTAPSPTPEPIAARMEMGFSVEDEEGCVGGSLGAHSEEGENREEHAAHMRKSDSIPTPKVEIAPRRTTRRLTAAEMQQAVVTAEILGKPRAMRAGRLN
ncbi:MAG: hypothetical protein IJ074_06875 [Clostridia bacterium]|nr:hypothetical protein [Clostridia bacterium]